MTSIEKITALRDRYLKEAENQKQLGNYLFACSLENVADGVQKALDILTEE